MGDSGTYHESVEMAISEEISTDQESQEMRDSETYQESEEMRDSEENSQLPSTEGNQSNNSSSSSTESNHSQNPSSHPSSSSTKSNQSMNQSASATEGNQGLDPPTNKIGTLSMDEEDQIRYLSSVEICRDIMNEIGPEEAQQMFVTELNYCEFSSPEYHRSEAADTDSQDTTDRSRIKEDTAVDPDERIEKWQTDAADNPSKQEDTVDDSRKRSMDYSDDDRYAPSKYRYNGFLENLSKHAGNQIAFLQKVAEYYKNYRRYPCADCSTLNTFIRNSLGADISSAEFMKEIIDLSKKYKAKDEEIQSNLDFLTTEERTLHELGLRLWGTTKVEDRATISRTKDEEQLMKNWRPPSNSKEPIPRRLGILEQQQGRHESKCFAPTRFTTR